MIRDILLVNENLFRAFSVGKSQYVYDKSYFHVIAVNIIYHCPVKAWVTRPRARTVLG